MKQGAAACGELLTPHTVCAMEGLVDAISRGPHCLQWREVTGSGTDLYWVCACGVAPIT
jgi:hypothetical protein